MGRRAPAANAPCIQISPSRRAASAHKIACAATLHRRNKHAKHNCSVRTPVAHRQQRRPRQRLAPCCSWRPTARRWPGGTGPPHRPGRRGQLWRRWSRHPAGGTTTLRGPSSDTRAYAHNACTYSAHTHAHARTCTVMHDVGASPPHTHTQPHPTPRLPQERVGVAQTARTSVAPNQRVRHAHVSDKADTTSPFRHTRTHAQCSPTANESTTRMRKPT